MYNLFYLKVLPLIERMALCIPWTAQPNIILVDETVPGPEPSGPPSYPPQNYPDASDLAPDNNYYFFYGSYFYTASKMTSAKTSFALISNKFASIEPPVVAAFSIGPLNGKMFIIDSCTTNNVKIYNFTGNATPIQPNTTTSVTSLFPDLSGIQPLGAAAASFAPARVYFFGGSPTQGFTYSYSTMTSKLTPLSTGATTLQGAWPSPIQTATQYYNVNNGTQTLFVFNITADAQFNANLQLVRGSSGTPNCGTSLPAVLRRDTCLAP